MIDGRNGRRAAAGDPESVTDEFRVSVIIPVYNAARRVRRAVESALALREVGEVILVEDGSPDKALSVCEDIASEFENVLVLRHADGGNHGAGASRNLGVRHARFSFVAFLDADDRYLASRFDADAEILTANPSVDGVYNAIGVEFESEAARQTWIEQGRPEVHTLTERVPATELIFVLLWSHQDVTGEFHTDGVTLRRDFLRQVGGFSETLRLQQDTHLWKRMAACGRLESGSLVDPVGYQCVHSENRMTRLNEQEKYRELWWTSLGECFEELRVSEPILQAFRRAYSAFRSTRRPRSKALLALGAWLVRDPAQILVDYGHFDLTMRQIFSMHPIAIRLLSAKNRLVRRLSRHGS
jgi:hypothetical protein